MDTIGTIKSGFRTSEFWISVATTAWVLLAPALSPVVQAVIGVGVPAAYTLGRTVVKAQAAKAAATAAAAKALAARPPGAVVGTFTSGDP